MPHTTELSMFFYLSKFLTLFLFPYPLFLLLTGWVLYRLPRGRLKLVYGLLFAGILFLSTNGGAELLLRPLENLYPHRTPALTHKASLVVVLSGMVNPLTPHQENPEFISTMDRILAGEELLEQGRAQYLLISGGSGLISGRGEPEAEILRKWLLKRGHRADRILAESLSRNTGENARNTAEIVKKRGWKEIILVTSAFHMPRSMMTFRKAGLDPIPYPVDYYTTEISPGLEGWFPTPTALSLSSIALKEYIGIVAYWFRGYI